MLCAQWWREWCGSKLALSENDAVLTKTDGRDDWTAAALGTAKNASFRVRLRNAEACFVMIGVAPARINKGGFNFTSCGYYMNCNDSHLFSGPPTSYNNKAYGDGQLPAGAVVSVLFGADARGRRTLSFAVDGRDLGVAYDDLPRDEDLYPAVEVGEQGIVLELLPL